MFPYQLKRRIKKILLNFDKSTRYYSQGGEDATLKGIFRKKLDKGEKGFYVDVGAFHPFKHSNTQFFYEKGWNGINIDARPGSMKIFQKFRKRDINIEVGVGEKAGFSTYYFLGEESTMNSFSKENLANIGVLSQAQERIKIEIRTLEQILNEHSASFHKIDFLSIDVEGYDYEVLRSNNWLKYKPDVIVVELNCVGIDDVQTDRSAKFLYSLGYRIIAKNVIMKDVASVFFVKNDLDY